jgi:hypothetical protein
VHRPSPRRVVMRVDFPENAASTTSAARD